MTDAFEDAYDIDMAVYKTSREGLLTRVAEEQKAGFRGADVIETNPINLTTLNQDGALAPYRSPQRLRTCGRLGARRLARREGRQHGRRLEHEERRARVSSPGPTRISRTRSGRGASRSSPADADWYKTVWEHWVASGKTPEEADRLFDAIGRNAVVVNGRSLQRQLLISGEVDVAAAQQRHNIQHSIDEGAPLAYEPIVEPVITRPDGVAVVPDPPNPAAALLFTDWLLSDGQDVLAEYGADATRRDLLVAPVVQRVEEDIPGFIANQDDWETRWEQRARARRAGPRVRLATDVHGQDLRAWRRIRLAPHDA